MPTASAEAASSALTFSGPSASGVTTGTSPAASTRRTSGGAVGSGRPTSPSSGTRVAFSPISSPASATASGPIARAQLLVDGGEAVAHDVERLRRRHAPPADELHLEPAPLHLLRDLRAGAVHDADRVAGGAKARDRVGRSPRRRAANLEDDEAHER